MIVDVKAVGDVCLVGTRRGMDVGCWIGVRPEMRMLLSVGSMKVGGDSSRTEKIRIGAGKISLHLDCLC